MLGRNARDTDDSSLELARRPGQEERRQRAWIGASLVIDGDLNSSEDITIAGRIEGNVGVPRNTVVIASGATVQGDIQARVVAVHGQVNGSIRADRKVEVGATGSISGNVTAPRMAVDEGATLRGRLDIAHGTDTTP